MTGQNVLVTIIQKSISIKLKCICWSLIHFMHVLSYFTVKSVKHKMCQFFIIHCRMLVSHISG
jgi:hypothetical protein